MDAASRRELDALRRRAWGAGGGLDDDPAAQARLAELEAESRAESPGGPPTPDVTAVTAAPGMPDPPTVDAEDPHPQRPAPPAPPRRTGHRARLAAALVGGAAAVTLAGVLLAPLLGDTLPGADHTELRTIEDAVRDATMFLDAPEAVTLFTVPLDGRLSDITGNTATLIPPALPDDRDSEWITPAGRYYSGQLWRARADTDELCLVVELAAGTRGTCLPEEAHRRNALLVVIPASDIPVDARPEGMTETDAVGFWWRADDNVEVVLAPLPAAAP
ncbi:hypothetical protein [Microbacterium aurantiacum]|uniref:Uncharacterized protein n=1 Tax=Microbacterium aurantiacum TaxID=162393 RepID=A0AAJ2HJK7_9MICO|nr:hypothetical protein [Microbacterium aurantiacum]MDS0245136.1 hypothetical protein [Microbacterium aurantiacum]